MSELVMDVDEAEKSSDSNSSQSQEEDEKEQKLLQRSKELEGQLSQNKYLYDVHVELVGIYRDLGDLTSMIAAYDRFRHYFPLTPKIWMDWLKDEMKLVTTPEEKKRVFELFEKATEDYLSVDLWIEYAQFSIGASDLTTTRSILEKGLSSAGLVSNKGSLLWDTLRELEHAHIALHPEGSDSWKAQVQRVADVFKRQLSVPLLDMESVYKEWKEWSETLPEGLVDPKPVEYGYKKAIKLLELYKPFEEALLTCETPEEYFKNYKEYIKAVTDPSTVICLYERAANELCLVTDFWIDYCTYVFKLGETALKVSKKALRNCPWSEELWVWRLRILENLKRGNDEVLKSFEQGLSSIIPSPGLEMWLAYLEYTHRCVGSPEKLDKLFQKAIEQLGCQNDRSYKVYKWYARMLAHRGDVKDARKIWSQIMADPENKDCRIAPRITLVKEGYIEADSGYSLKVIQLTYDKAVVENVSVEIEYIETRSDLYGKYLCSSKLIYRCLFCTQKSSALVWLEYATLERQYGEPQMLRIIFQKALNAIKDWPQYIMDEWILYERHFGTLEDVLKCVQRCKETSEVLRQKYEQCTTNQRSNNTTRQAFEDPNVKDRKRRHEEDDKIIDQKKFRNEGSDRRKETKKDLEKTHLQIREKNRDTTVFVSNIHSSVDESKLKEMFPTAVAVEIVRDKHGKSRCFGYVQFSKQEETMIALARDREPLDGRPVFISELKLDKHERKPAFKYSQTVEGNKLFVKGLPFSKSKEDVQRIFEPYGAKDVRLIYKKSGQSKGIAYVEFDTEEQAKKAIEKTDRMKIDEHEISVAVSAPPPKTAAQVDNRDKEPIRHARTMLMVPRSLQVKNAPTSSKIKDAPKNEPKESIDSSDLPPPKSNADFRNMLLKK